MISNDGFTPILMDLGSLSPSPTPVTSRSLALAVQDQAAEHSTMPYRAPELFDVKTGSVIDTKVDIWSLGCTLYACLTGKSPFEARSEETGGSLSICVLGGDWRFPGEGAGGGGGGVGKGKGKSPAILSPATTERAITNGASAPPPPKNGKTNATKTEIHPSIKAIVRACLRVEPAERPDIDDLIAMLEGVVDEVPPDEDNGDEGG